MNITHPITLLVIDDEEYNVKLIESYFESEFPQRFHMLSAANGPDGLEILAKHHQEICAILLDRIMEGMNGIQVLERIQHNAQWRNIPVIMQTAAITNSEMKEGLHAGAYYYLPKPYDPEILVTVIDSALKEFPSS